MKKLLFTAAIFVASFSTFAQVGIDTTDPKGVLDVVSTNSGVVLPRVAAADVTSPINGMIIYDTTINCFNFFQNGAWTGCIGATPTDPSTNGTGVATSYGAPTCTANTITGAMATGTAVSGVTMEIYANVTTLGDYNITAGPTNGVTFTGTGTFAATGCQLVTLTGSGTPVADGTFTYTTNTTPAATADATVSLPATICTVANSPTTTVDFLCHNLGADTALDSHTPVKGLNGDYYQWGRNAPAADVDNLIGSWGSQGGNSNDGNWTPTAKGPEDPCPTGFRVPSQAEWTAVNANNTASRTGTFTNSPTNFSAALHYGPDANTKSLTLPAAGRYRTNGVLNNRGSNGYYWSSTENGSPAYNLTFNSSNVIPANNLNRNYGFSVRCIAE